MNPDETVKPNILRAHVRTAINMAWPTKSSECFAASRRCRQLIELVHRLKPYALARTHGMAMNSLDIAAKNLSDHGLALVQQETSILPFNLTPAPRKEHTNSFSTGVNVVRKLALEE